MRVWCVPVEKLTRMHLFGEHREIHTMLSVLEVGHGGYYNHPQTQRFVNRIPQLRQRHDDLVEEMKRRGYTGHKTPVEGEKEFYQFSEIEQEIDEAIIRQKIAKRPYLV